MMGIKVKNPYPHHFNLRVMNGDGGIRAKHKLKYNTNSEQIPPAELHRGIFVLISLTVF